jgi:Sec-independent protein translocase protein TatA
MAYENAMLILLLGGLVLFFGSKKLPELARAIGRSQMEFEIARSATIKEGQKEIQSSSSLTSNETSIDNPDWLYRAKLEKAALSAGIQDPRRLTNEELVQQIKSYLERI